ncbi:MAG: hypothetical protein K0R24_2213 [Gammaproteobacteria bacterium]|jgi:hypothetical protein|nr:hypothetical protein [Gammaproteobacteria bacterium]MDF3055744.1 hypothetical protein [Gammaproteobacteria bacterium]
MDGRKEEKKSTESGIAFNQMPSPNNPSDNSFYRWLASRDALIVIGTVPENEVPHISDLIPSSPLKEGVHGVPSHRKRKSEGGLGTIISFSKKQTPPVSPKLPSRRPNNNSPLLFPSKKNPDSLPPVNHLESNDDALSPCEQELLDALLKKLEGKPTRLLIAEKAIAKQRMLHQQQPPPMMNGQ